MFISAVWSRKATGGRLVGCCLADIMVCWKGAFLGADMSLSEASTGVAYKRCALQPNSKRSLTRRARRKSGANSEAVRRT